MLLAFSFFELSADHIVGSEIVYDYSGNNQYKVYTSIFRNCNDCKFNGIGGGTNTSSCNDLTRLDIYGYNSSQGKYLLLGTTGVTRIQIKDASKLCPGDSSTCTQNSTYSFGIEEHIFESDVNLSSYIDNGYNEFKIGFSKDNRSSGISFPVTQNHFNFCYINTLFQQSSPKTDGFLTNQVYTNNPVYLDASFRHSNFDSIAYVLDSAYISLELTNSYPAGKSPTNPLNVLAGNDALVYKPQGTFLDSFTGQLIFTPTLNGDIGAFVIECQAFKDVAGKMTLISKVRRDFEIRVINSSNNAPYYFGLANGTFKACAGEEYSDDLFYADESTGMVDDTVYLHYRSKNTLPIQLDHVTRNFAPFRTSTFTWDVPEDAARDEPYIFYIEATDSNCPALGLSYYNYTIQVEKAKEITASKAQTNCNSYLFTADNASPTDFLRFAIFDSNRNEIAGTAVLNDSAELVFPSPGKWYVQLLSLERGANCSYKHWDSVQIVNFEIPSIDLGPDFSSCYLEDLSIVPSVSASFTPVVLNWFVEDFAIPGVQNQLDTQFRSSKIIRINLEDASGCKTSDSVFVEVNPLWNNAFKDTGLCLNYPTPLYLPSALKDTLGLKNWNFLGTNVIGNEFSASGLGIGDYKIYVQVQDTFNCIYQDSFEVSIGQPFTIGFNPFNDFCQFSGNLNLNALAAPNPSTGAWTYDPNPSLIKNQQFDANIADSGLYRLQYSVTQDGCTVDTINELRILLAPTITVNTPIPDSICQSTSPFKIEVAETDRLILINGVADSIFKAFQYDDIANIRISRGHTLNQCTNRWDKTVTIDSTVQARLILDKPILCFEDKLISLSLTRNDYPSQWSTNGTGLFTSQGVNKYEYQVSAAEKASLSTILFSINLESGNTCPNLQIDSIIRQNAQLIMGYDSFKVSNCEPGSLSLKLNDLNFFYYDSVQWYLNGAEQRGNGFANDQHTFRNLSRGLQNVQIIPFVNGCQNTIDTSVRIDPKPNPILAVTPEKFYSARFPNISFEVVNFKPNYNYNWSTDPAYQGLDGNNPYHFTMPSDTGLHEFTLYTTSDKGCKDTLKYSAICLPKDWILIPNAFSPNSDGPAANEVFKAEGRITSDFVLQVFNMWGEKLFETQDINQGWDGNYQNEPCSPGNYIYIVKFTDDIGRPIEMKGNLILLR